jgi:hypothetical protein
MHLLTGSAIVFLTEKSFKATIIINAKFIGHIAVWTLEMIYAILFSFAHN